MLKLVLVLPVVAVVIGVGVIAVIGAGGAGAHSSDRRVDRVTVPPADRFTPFALTIHAGDTVRWVNNDEDDHTVVSDNAFDTTGHQGTDQILSADGGKFHLRFRQPGTFVYYCRFHAHLDAHDQPVAPGPEGGIERGGNFGTPMSGVITVLPSD